ncbi:MAG TPA: hypothetical protein VLA52_14985 [Thermohalobaculum sp.]|nr:hypothetical protein [Thermohalobaculum sp.]
MPSCGMAVHVPYSGLGHIWTARSQSNWQGFMANTSHSAGDGVAGVERPQSCTNTWINLVGLVCFFLTVWLLHDVPIRTEAKALFWMLAATGPIMLLDFLILRVHRRASTGLQWDRGGQVDLARVAVKLIGWAVTIGAIGAIYWALPEYHRDFYAPFWLLLRTCGPYLAIAAVPYFIIVDRRMRDPYDAYWHLGLLALGQTRGIDWPMLGNHARGWIVKGFFLPLMISYLAGEVTAVGEMLAGQRWATPMQLYELAYRFTFSVDLVFAAAGYIMTFRLLDTHIRSAEPTVLGWLVAIMCYQPFWNVFATQFLQYHDDLYWDNWLTGMPWLQVLWGSTIIAVLVIYGLATMTFGARFSNLTHRGILTNGPFRFTKHPAYLTKNLSWWLVSVPFVSAAGWEVALRYSIALFGINLIYFARARTEERHLSMDPVYVQYALWINEHGALAWLGRLIPFFRYVPPAGTVVARDDEAGDGPQAG